jgi:hypothetical protein
MSVGFHPKRAAGLDGLGKGTLELVNESPTFCPHAWHIVARVFSTMAQGSSTGVGGKV